MERSTSFRVPVGQLSVCLIVAVALASSVFAQAPTAELSGTVTDSSGAVVIGAGITVTNEGTALKRSAKSNHLGLFTVPLLPPGRYRVLVQQSGFRPVERTGLTLHVNANVQLDFSLEVGALNDTITVSGETPLLETSQSSQGAVIDNAKIVNLPLNMRNPFTLAALTPGVQPQGGFFTPRVFQEQAFQSDFTVNGGVSFQNDILLDGAKLVGILPESTIEGPGPVTAVIGIGINLAHAPEGLGRATTCLAAHGVSVTPERMLDALSVAMTSALDLWNAGTGFASIRERWLDDGLPAGTPMTVDTGHSRQAGTFRGLGPDGALILRDQSGYDHPMSYGDVTIEPAAGAPASGGRRDI